MAIREGEGDKYVHMLGIVIYDPTMMQLQTTTYMQKLASARKIHKHRTAAVVHDSKTETRITRALLLRHHSFPQQCLVVETSSE